MYSNHNLINSIHYALILFYVICWILELVVEMAIFVVEFLGMIVRSIINAAKGIKEEEKLNCK